MVFIAVERHNKTYKGVQLYAPTTLTLLYRAFVSYLNNALTRPMDVPATRSQMLGQWTL